MNDKRLIRATLGTAVVVLTLSLFSCVSASEITAVPANALVVDVRTAGEFADWHYPDAINIPVQVLDKQLDKLPDKKKTIIVYCRSGNRSSTAKKILLSNGYEDVKNGGGVRDMKKLLP
jgi:rhodanese-related sulfurtransferase